MRIQHIHVQRFRSIFDATLKCDQLTAMVGANGAGKSTFLRALAIFYNPNATIEIGDFYNTATNEPITITVCYTDLTDREREAFPLYIHNDQLIVEKSISWDEAKNRAVSHYYGQKMQHRKFMSLRETRQNYTVRRPIYLELKSQPDYATLPAVSSSEATLIRALEAWEKAHPEQCELLSSPSQFFGIKQVGIARLELYTRFLLIEAQRDAHIAGSDERDSPIKQLLDEVVRNVLAENESVRQLQQQATQALRDISKQVDLTPLNEELNTTMRQFAPNTGIRLQWQEPELSLPTPRVHLSLSEDGYNTPINRTGHGVQRAFIITLLQHLAMSARQGTETTPAPQAEAASDEQDGEQTPIAQQVLTPPNLILAIEEPELYQHPTRQRHFAAILHDLAHGSVKGVATNLQVLYCTHSPYFVSLDRFEQIRVIGKVLGPQTGSPKCSKVWSSTRADFPNLSEAQLAMVVSSSVNEGFFARVAVLVEGDGDRALLQTVARHYKYPLEGHGVAIIAVEGKGTLNKPMIIFREMGIDVYSIWDNDSDKQGDERSILSKENRMLLSLVGETEIDWPGGTYAKYTVFNPNLEIHLRNEVCATGLNWDDFENNVCSSINVRKKGLWKKHTTVTYAVQRALSEGCTFSETRKILEHICAMASIDTSHVS